MTDNQDRPEYKMMVKNVRLSFPHLRKPYEEGGKLSGKFLIDKEEQADQIEKLKTLIHKCMVGELEIKKMPQSNTCLRDGDEEDREEQEGMMVLSASESAVQVLSRKRETISAEDAPNHPDEPYGGCYVNVLIRLWAQNNKEYGKKINANLVGVQFARHGDAFGRQQEDVTDEFGDIEDDAGEDDWL